MMASDQWTAAKWAQLGIGSHSLFGLRVDDFEVVRPLDPTLGDGRDGRDRRDGRRAFCDHCHYDQDHLHLHVQNDCEHRLRSVLGETQ